MSVPLLPEGFDPCRRPTEPDAAVPWLLARTALRGTTVVPVPLLFRSLAGVLGLEPGDPGVEAAVRSSVEEGAAVVLPGTGPAEGTSWISLATVAEAEESLAEHVERLLVTAETEGEGVVAYLDVEGARTPETPETPEVAVPEGSVVVRAAERLGLAAALTLFEEVPDGGRVVLVGDPRRLPGRGPGRVLRDLLVSAAVRARTPSAAPASPLGVLAAEVRAGRLVAPEAPGREVVVVPAQDDAAVRHRVTQLVVDSVPRTFGVSPPEILVLTPLRRGTAGALDLEELLRERGVTGRVATVDEAASVSAEAVVLALPAGAAGVVDRALLLSAVTRATRHLSVVTAAGAALPVAVARPGTPPRTRLAELLALVG